MSLKSVPQLLPPQYGWGLLLTYMNGLVFVALRVVHVPVATSGLSGAKTAGKGLIVPLVIQALSVVLVFTHVQVRRCGVCVKALG